MKFFRMLAVLLAVVCMTFGGKALAAEDGMKVFQDAYLPAMNQAQNYHLELIFHGPTFQSNLVASSQIGMDGSGVADGTLSWAYTNMDTKQTQQNDIPIYAERSGNSIVLYGQRNGSWQRENVLEGLAWILDAVSANDRATRLQYAAAVKTVTASDVGNGRQSMRIILDGRALAEMENKAVRERIDSMGDAEKKDATEFLHYINAALAENDIECTWTIDKKTGKTVTVATDLTGIMRGYAKAVLEDSYQGQIALTPEETEFLASIGYYYDLQFYLTNMGESAGQVVIPAAVKRDAKDSNLFNDIEAEVISVVKK
ncbi:MAG: hypothetical protein IJT01_03910 [Selenomonadaceae bacterium]|nr:hypothetical protein [Selenomonadaceae bacterium]